MYLLQEAIQMSHSYHPNASSERTSVKPDTRPPWGELEGDEKDEGRQTGALNQSDRLWRSL